MTRPEIEDYPIVDVTMSQSIILKKVKVHNLKNIDLTLPTNQLIVFTGVSGSGKSSLAFDTIYVEGQRRYIESLSHQARRFLGDLPKPEAESISGIAPTIAIEQKTAGKTPRSTVGTMTGIYDFLRVLYSKIAIPHCPVSKEPVAVQSREKIIAKVQSEKDDKKLYFLAPIAKGKKGEFTEEFANLQSKGFMRVRIDGVITEITPEISLSADSAHDIDVVIDRVKGSEKTRIAEAVILSLEIGNGYFSVYNPDSEEEIAYSQFAYSQKSNLSYQALQPTDFSFNHPEGMCPSCQGLGTSFEFDLTKIINPNLSIAENCCEIAPSYETVRYGNIYNNLAKIYKFDINDPWKKLSDSAKHVFLYGTEKKWTKMIFVHPEKGSSWQEFVQWRGVLQEAKDRLNAAKSDLYRKKLSALMIEGSCSSCLGARIKPYPAEAQIQGKKIHEITNLPLEDCFEFFQNLKLTDLEKIIAEELLKEIKTRLQFLLNVGLSYLSLDRISPTLSGGESQRVRLASQIGAGLVGAVYVLDEPSIGLHPSDHHKLIHTMIELKKQGNTVIVVEHDADTIRAADTIVEVGPGAGKRGGEILAIGSLDEILKNPKSITAQYLLSEEKITKSLKKKKLSNEKITIVGACHHNLKNVTVDIPLNGLICVTGVSGSGKSSLISDILYPALSNHLHNAGLNVGKHQKIEGIKFIDKVISVDQSPIGRTPRSNPATYIKLFDEIRDLYSELPESRMKGLNVGHFSFNVKDGSCAYCSGLGQVKIDMDFMEDVWVECPQCKGQRFDSEILSIKFKGKNIHEVLLMDVETALDFFGSIPSIAKKLKLLSQVGLDYLSIGQPSTTLSGGEAQRIKLAKELVRPQTGKTLYILDEPTTGLHFQDVQRLIQVLQKLVDQGNTVCVIEHNLDLIKVSDHIIDLGPGAGIHGGEIIGTGAPDKIAKLSTPTGLSIANKLGKIEKKHTENTKVIEKIVVKNAHQNNLKNIDLEIPRNAICVFSGPSGSGKSSLAFDTLYAEGQRRYTETLSSYARTLVKPLPKPKADKIEGLSPSIALEQKTGGLNPRSTIGTVTEIYDFLRLLYAHKGIAHDPETLEEIKKIDAEFVVSKLLETCESEKVQILAPLKLEKKESFSDFCSRLNREGFLRIRLNGKFFELDEEIPFEEWKKNDIHLVIDRLVVEKKNQMRLLEAIKKATEFANKIVIVALQSKDLFYNLSFAVESSGKSFPAILPQTFSFNHDSGMCLECQGLGITYGAHIQQIRSLYDYSILDVLDFVWKDFASKEAIEIACKYFQSQKIDSFCPLEDLPTAHLDVFFKGGPEALVDKKNKLILSWNGLETQIARLVKAGKTEIKDVLLPLMTASTCPSCKGSRLNPLANHVTINGKSIHEFCSLTLTDAKNFMATLVLDQDEFLSEVLDKIKKHLDFLISLGLQYLNLNRSAPTLSGGELQRIRLARQLGSGLTSCLYILDEPTIGLHPYDSALLNQALQNLKNLGNTLVLVEHDPLTVSIADYIVDFGPKSGKYGGQIIAQGTYKEILSDENSLTGQYLSGKKSVPIAEKKRKLNFGVWIDNANLHNLKNISCKIPLGAITCLTGVSGSGKSTLMRHLLKPAIEKSLNTYKKLQTIEYLGTKFKGLDAFDKMICIDQSPIGQTSRADVSTYSEIQPLIRLLFSGLPLAKSKGLSGAHFSPNHKRGMCKTCFGMGYKTIDLQFLPSAIVTCESCKGNRLNPLSLEIKYKEKSFGDVLKLSILEALDFFSAIPRIVKRLKLLQDVGLSYLHLNQEVNTLSGGEAQRLRLSRELSKRDTGKTLYLIDEPTVGLHASDVELLLPIFHKLADKKNTLIIIEHNVDIIKNADYIIDLGPDAGPLGGYIVAEGTVEAVKKVKTSKTGLYL